MNRFLPRLSASLSNDAVAVGLVISVIFAVAILVDQSHIHIFRHDAVFYIDSYLDKLKGEGRWINYLLFPVLKLIPGQAASLLDVLFFFVFCTISTYRWTGSLAYAFLLSLLFIQVPPLYGLILWPVTILPAFAILLLAAVVATRMPPVGFYLLFGMLFLGTMSNFYYLLPLLHLNLLNASSTGQNIRILFVKIIPAWALGFVVGYLIAVSMIYVFSGQIGMVIAEWRTPHYVHNVQDLSENIQRSFSMLNFHISEIITGSWYPIFFVFALLIGLFGKQRNQFILSIFLALCIMVSHYVITIPVGIVVEWRTILATFVGVLACAFFIPSVKNWQVILLTPLIVLLTVSFYKHNHNVLQWYSVVTNVYYEELLKASPLAPQLYSGVILIVDDSDVRKLNQTIENRFNLGSGLFEGLDDDKRWRPAAHEAGFRHVKLCGHALSPRCEQLTENYTALQTSEKSGLYQAIGVTEDGYLLITFNSEALISY